MGPFLLDLSFVTDSIASNPPCYVSDRKEIEGTESLTIHMVRVNIMI